MKITINHKYYTQLQGKVVFKQALKRSTSVDNRQISYIPISDIMGQTFDDFIMSKKYFDF